MTPDLIDISGVWQVQLKQKRRQKKWLEGGKSHLVNLPGSLTENNIGYNISMDTPWTGFTGRGGWKSKNKYEPYRDPEDIKIPFWLQPKKYYKGKAWYRLEFEIPPSWDHKYIFLFLERCHWASKVWIDGKKIGAHNSLSTPHVYELGTSLHSGKHDIIICVDNSYLYRIGIDSHAITDHTQTNWNGIIGKMKLIGYDNAWIEKVDVFPNYETKNARVKIQFRNHLDKKIPVSLSIRAEYKGDNLIKKQMTMELPKKECTKNLMLHFGKDVPLWNEFDPNLIRLNVEMNSQNISHRKEKEFGFRNIQTEGKQFLLNGNPVFFRGTLDCCTFPLSGYPSTKSEDWMKIFRTCKNHGLNHIRFHSWCPPRAAFRAADKIGIYLQPECPVWRGLGGLRWAKRLKPFLYKETTRILETYGNHPSFVLFCHGNESWQLTKWRMRRWTKFAKQKTSRQLVTSAAHYKLVKQSQFHIAGAAKGFHLRYHKIFNKTYPSTKRRYYDQIKKETVPIIAHETGQWCVFPNLKEISKYKGVLAPNNLKIVRDFLEHNGLLEQADEFLINSGKFQAELYKESIEAFLRTPKMGGFQLLDLNDFPGQGTALVGVLDAFWEEKGYIKPEEFHNFCAPVVPLIEMEKRTWQTNESFRGKLLISQFFKESLRGVQIKWAIKDSDGNFHKEGKFTQEIVPVGLFDSKKTITAKFSEIEKASLLCLSVEIICDEWGEIKNTWDIWVFPSQINIKSGKIIQTRTLNEALGYLKQEKEVLLAPPPKYIKSETFGSFEPIFWNKSWFPRQKPHTLGLICRKNHVALGDFPTEEYCSWQWWPILRNSKPLVLDEISEKGKIVPIVQPIDDWNECRKLALLFECRVGAGKLVVSAADLLNEQLIQKYPEMKQLRFSVINYMNSEKFSPDVHLRAEELKELIKK